MADAPKLGTRRLPLDGAWSLLELSGFGRQYVQSYSFFHAIRFGADGEMEGMVEYAFRGFPWRGGWSTVDFYEVLQSIVPEDERCRVVAIEYASPGYIDLGVVLSAAVAISGIVRHICKSIDRANATYIARMLARAQVSRDSPRR